MASIIVVLVMRIKNTIQYWHLSNRCREDKLANEQGNKRAEEGVCEREKETINGNAKWKYYFGSPLLALLIPSIAFVWMGIYCVIKISDKKKYLYFVNSHLSQCMFSACIAFIWTKCTYSRGAICVVCSMVAKNARNAEYENLCTYIFIKWCTIARAISRKK